MIYFHNRSILIPSLLLTISTTSPIIAHAAPALKLDSLSVTATRVDRLTREVPAAITVIDEDLIESTKMMNIKDALQGVPGLLIDSKNGGYDVRLIIRGAGQKANFGVREIMVLRDGVPMTDPDSFSRFDFIDTQDIEQIEVTKGPGSLFAAGSAGGTIQLLSKSPFDVDSNRIRIGLGNEGAENYNLRHAMLLNENNAISITASRRVLENGWREWNEFDSNQISFKHGLKFNESDTLDTEISYSEADIQLPGSMDEAQFDEYKRTGKQTDNSNAWKDSGRYSKIWFFNTRLETQLTENLRFRPKAYYTHWTHYHPVTGAINDNEDNGVASYGTDLEFVFDHQLWGESTLVAGVTARQEKSDDSRKYQYRDVKTIPFGPQAGRIIATLSDKKGALLQTEDSTNTLFGFYFQETLRPSDKWLIDIGLRYDRSNFDIKTNEIGKYNFATGKYGAGAGLTKTDKTFKLLSPKVGVSYQLSDTLSAFGTIARSDQVPSSNEINESVDLDESTATNFEVGLKGRHQKWSFDTSVYYTEVKDEIMALLLDHHTTFQNAGKTDKKGFEFAGNYQLFPGLQIGVNYAYSDYTFKDFTEVIGGGPGATQVSHAGNQMPYVPKHQYGLFAHYQSPNGLKARIQTNSWGEYYIDNANTEKYDGYDFVTNMMIGYERGPHSIALNIDNVFDKQYAVEVKKSSRGTKSYSAASPRTAMLIYTYNY